MTRFALTLFLISGNCALGQTVPVKNASFEEGGGTPAGWSLSGGEGRWLDGDAADGKRAIAVTGNGQDSNFWLSEPIPFEPDAVYRLRFRAKGLGGEGGTPISGPSFANLDLDRIPGEWREYSSVFLTPEKVLPEESRLRFGQWQVKGSVAFDSIDLVRVDPVHRREGDLVLGDGESVEGCLYEFRAPFRSASRNLSRALERHRCGFNSDRWVFADGSEVVYRHRVGSRRLLEGAVEVSVTWHAGGDLAVEISADGKDWRALGRIEGLATRSFPIPKEMLPAAEVEVRLRGSPAEKPGAKPVACGLQVGGYGFRATLDGDPARAKGKTEYLAVRSADPRLKVAVESLGDLLPGGRNEIVARIAGPSGAAIPSRAVLTISGSAAPVKRTVEANLPAGEQVLRVPYEVPDAGSYDLAFSLEGTSYRAETSFRVPELHRTSYGERLPGSSGAADLWWASSGWKVSETRPPPAAAGEAVLVRTARNEVEAAQLVVRPKRDLRGFSARATDLKGPGGATIPAANVEVLRVAYVPVIQPTDSTGAAGLWPDPLPPFRGPIDLAAGRNQPLWIAVKAPREAPGGSYAGTIELLAKDYAAGVPLRVEVFGFELPGRMTCTTAFGFSPGEIWRYQKIKDPERRRAVLEKYLEDFGAHHISPYDPAPLDPFGVSWPKKEEIQAGRLEPRFDWARWDAAMERAIDRRHFNSFNLPVPGLGGGTFHSRVEPSLLGFGEGTPEYKGLLRAYLKGVESHLREKGWLDEAYVYWFDEPDPKDYGFVMEGFRKLKEGAPGIRRMLTEQVEPGLVGGPDLWCPITPEYKHEAAEERRKHGERFWWYVCTGPKAPYCTLFIDHPATELRVWLWQTWGRKIDGILVWSSNYWTSDCAYPDPKSPQDPYRDPMGWVSGYDTPAGVRNAWGNGDGRFIYPPEAAAGARQEEEVLEGPVRSIRWEMLRDGIEDYEYLAILKRLLERSGGKLAPGERKAFESLLEVPAGITRDMTAFTRDPAPIEERRGEIARAIERLSAP